MDVPQKLVPEFIYIPDAQSGWASSEESLMSPISSPVKESSKKIKPGKEWSPYISGKPRIISQGDLRYQTGMKVIAVLPFYFDVSCNQVKSMFAVEGKIIDVYHCDTEGRDIPRETKLRSSPIPNLRSQGSIEMSWSKFESLKDSDYASVDWATPLISNPLIPPVDNVIQTIVTSYKICLNREHYLDKSQISKLNTHARLNGKLPYKYDLKFQENKNGEFDTIIVHYRYIMGTTRSVYKGVRDANPSIPTVDIYDINRILENSCKLYTGCAAEYVDTDPQGITLGRNCRFMCVDYICVGVFDIRHVVKPLDSTERILSLRKLIDFDIRMHYNVDDYYCFHPIDTNYYTIHKYLPDHLSHIRAVLRKLFSRLEIFTVKKSLRKPEDEIFYLHENEHGGIKCIESGNTLEGYTNTGIGVSKYVKGLAYPQSKMPTKNDQYIFFDSKEYCDLDMDPSSPTFMELIVVEDERMYRDPCPRDILLGQSFVCNRGNFKGRHNLKWFYPSVKIRTLHFIFTNSKNLGTSHPYIHREKFDEIALYLFDLWTYGSSPKNPTLDSEFSKSFMSVFLWQALLQAELEKSENYDYLNE